MKNLIKTTVLAAAFIFTLGATAIQPVQAAEKQQGQTGIHITLMHTDGEQEHRQDDKGTETEIS